MSVSRSPPPLPVFVHRYLLIGHRGAGLVGHPWHTWGFRHCHAKPDQGMDRTPCAGAPVSAVVVDNWSDQDDDDEEEDEESGYALLEERPHHRDGFLRIDVEEEYG